MPIPYLPIGPSTDPDYPAESDVRATVAYGDGTYTGTLEVTGGSGATAEEVATAVVAALNGLMTVSAINPTDADGNTTIVLGDDYADGTANPSLSYVITGYTGPAVSGATVRWKAIPRKKYIKAGETATPDVSLTNGTATLDGTTLTLKQTLTGSNTASLTHMVPPEDAPNYKVVVQLVSQAGAVMTQHIGDGTFLRPPA